MVEFLDWGWVGVEMGIRGDERAVLVIWPFPHQLQNFQLSISSPIVRSSRFPRVKVTVISAHILDDKKQTTDTSPSCSGWARGSLPLLLLKTRPYDTLIISWRDVVPSRG